MGGANSAGSLAEAGHFNLAEAFFARVSEALPDGYSLNLGDDPRNSMICARGKGEICSPFLLNGDIATAAGKDWASEIEFLNPFCQPVRCEISWKELASFRGDPIGKLAGDGLRVHCREETEALISDYRKKTPGRLLTRLSGPGWSDDGLAFALQSGDLVSLEDNSAYRAPASQRQAEIRGTFDEWRDGIGAMASQNPNMIFAISAGLSPAILRFLPSGSSTICHFFGPTSVGKTRLLRVGLSVWPREATAEQNWHSTVNGLEGVMQARNDHLCALDELPAVPETRLSDAIYMIGNGVGKERANAEGKSGERHTWRTVVLSSGESTIWSSLRNSGSVVKGGLSVRAIDIPVEGRYGAFDCLHGHKDIKAFLDRLDSCVSATSGTAAEAFITALMVRGPEQLSEEIPDRVQRCSERLEKDLGDLAAGDGRNEIHRVLRLFAMVCTAGELGVEDKVLPWGAGEVYASVLCLARRWLALRGTRPRDEDETLEKLRNFLTKNSQNFLTSPEVEQDPTAAKRAPGIADDDYYHLWSWSLSNALNCQNPTGHDFKRAVEHLHRAGVLVAGGERGTLQVRMSGYGKNLRDRAYRIARSIID